MFGRFGTSHLYTKYYICTSDLYSKISSWRFSLNGKMWQNQFIKQSIFLGMFGPPTFLKSWRINIFIWMHDGGSFLNHDRGYNPSYPLVRPFIGVITPFISIVVDSVTFSFLESIFLISSLQNWQLSLLPCCHPAPPSALSNFDSSVVWRQQPELGPRIQKHIWFCWVFLWFFLGGKGLFSGLWLCLKKGALSVFKEGKVR